MLTEDLKVILLEINRSPDPSNNTRYQRELFDNLGIEFQPISRNFYPFNSRISSKIRPGVHGPKQTSNICLSIQMKVDGPINGLILVILTPIDFFKGVGGKVDGSKGWNDSPSECRRSLGEVDRRETRRSFDERFPPKSGRSFKNWTPGKVDKPRTCVSTDLWFLILNLWVEKRYSPFLGFWTAHFPPKTVDFHLDSSKWANHWSARVRTHWHWAWSPFF